MAVGVVVYKAGQSGHVQANASSYRTGKVGSVNDSNWSCSRLIRLISPLLEHADNRRDSGIGIPC